MINWTEVDALGSLQRLMWTSFESLHIWRELDHRKSFAGAVFALLNRILFWGDCLKFVDDKLLKSGHKNRFSFFDGSLAINKAARHSRSSCFRLSHPQIAKATKDNVLVVGQLSRNPRSSVASLTKAFERSPMKVSRKHKKQTSRMAFSELRLNFYDSNPFSSELQRTK